MKKNWLEQSYLVATVMLRRGVIHVFFIVKFKKKGLEDSEKNAHVKIYWTFGIYGESASQALLLNIIDTTRHFEQK